MAFKLLLEGGDWILCFYGSLCTYVCFCLFVLWQPNSFCLSSEMCYSAVGLRAAVRQQTHSLVFARVLCDPR